MRARRGLAPVPRTAACRGEEAINARVVDGHLLRRELRLQILEPVVGIDAETVAARVRQVERHSEAIEGVTLSTEELLEDALLGAEERVAHAAVRLEAGSHDVEDPGTEAACGLEFVGHDDDSLSRPFRETLREV